MSRGTRARAIALALVVVAALGAALAGAARAHIVPIGLGMQSYLKLEPSKVYLEYNLGFSDLAGFSEVLKMESNRDSILEQGEIEAWLDGLQPKILQGLEVTLDGRRLAFRLIERKTFALFAGTNLQEVNGVPFDTWWYFEADADIARGEHKFVLRDRNFENEVSQSVLWVGKHPRTRFRTYAFDPEPNARVLDVGTEWQVYGRSLTLFAEFARGAVPEAEPSPSPSAPTAVASIEPGAKSVEAVVTATATAATASAAGGSSPGMRALAEKTAREAGVRIEYRGAEETEEARSLVGLRFETWYVAIALALIWGAAHALAPGHGKSMVAAYLLGTAGRIRDAIALGAVVTITHTASIFVLAVVVFFLAERVFGMNANSAAGRSAIVMEIVAGAIVFLMGVGILYRRLQGIDGHGHSHGPGGHHHDHRHGHAHAHSRGDAHAHAHGAEGAKGKGVLALGFAAGFQPCTAGIALVFMSLAQSWLWKGLYLLVAFSLGLGLVIVAIAVTIVTARSLLADSVKPEGRFIRALPALSAALLTVVGAWMVVDVLVKNRIGPFAGG